MAHNPILEQRKLGLWERPATQVNTQQVLVQQNGQVLRTLQEGVSFSERLGGKLWLYTIDVAPHTFTWKVSLPSSHYEDFFPTTLTLRYKVSNPEKIITEAIDDTERLMMRTLESSLRKCSRGYALHQYLELEAKLAEKITSILPMAQSSVQFQETPIVELLETSIVEFDFSDAEWRQIKSMQVVQSAEHVVQLPTAELAYKFIATTTVKYKLHNAAQIPTNNLADVEQQLWPGIQRILRRTSSQYKVTDVTRAEAAIQDAIDAQLKESGIIDMGLEAVNVDVWINQDETAQMHAAELALTDHESQLESQKLEGVQSRMPFYEELINKGSWMALALAVAKGQISEEALYRQMNQEEKEQLNLKISLLKELRSEDAKNERQDHDASSELLDSVVRDVTRRPTGPALPPTAKNPQLTTDLDPANEDDIGE